MSALTNVDLDSIFESPPKKSPSAPKPVKPLVPSPATPDSPTPGILATSPDSATPGILATSIDRNTWEKYVDRYPYSLGIVYETIIKATGVSKAAFGEQHYFEHGYREGRVLTPKPDSDLIDYGYYVENYATLVEPFRKGIAGPQGVSLFEWGKWHHDTYGKTENRSPTGGIDWGAIIRNNKELFAKYTDARKAKSELTAFQFGFENQSLAITSEGVKIGTEFKDIITGRRIFALADDDVIAGSDDGDIISGGSGNDKIDGAGGRDLVFGGGGSDLFFIPSEGITYVRDFRKGADAIKGKEGSKYKLELSPMFDYIVSTDIVDETRTTRMNVAGVAPWDLTFAIKSGALDNVYI